MSGIVAHALFGHLVGVLIVVLMLVFIGIWYWAWRPRHKATFDELAQIPMRESEDPEPRTKDGT